MSDLESVLDKVLVNSGERKFLVIIYGKAMKNNEFTQSQSSLIATIAISFGHYPILKKDQGNSSTNIYVHFVLINSCPQKTKSTLF